MFKMPLISPSLMACDLLNVKEELDAVTNAGADRLHIDIMDNHFVPNLTFGPDFTQQIIKNSTLPVDVHLMVSNVKESLLSFLKIGVHGLSFHVEAEPHIYRYLSLIKEKNCKAGLALNPGTPWSVIEPVVHLLDYVIVMSVNPGFGGQKFISKSIEKIKKIHHNFPELSIMVDGGITNKTAADVTNAGANILVAGSYIFDKSEISLYSPEILYAQKIQKLKQLKSC